MSRKLRVKTPNLNERIKNLSGGNQQKVVLGKWLTRGAKVFLFDEPTAGIDVTGRAEIYDRIRGLAEEGHGVIVVSSDFSEFPGLCHRVLVMREGELAGELVGDSITESRIVAACYERAAAVQQI